ncbi:MAG: hypothetical protein J6O18_06605 [Bacilli bacterium]|nr:hypothetical protein [Bacilli bacterium]
MTTSMSDASERSKERWVAVFKVNGLLPNKATRAKTKKMTVTDCVEEGD